MPEYKAEHFFHGLEKHGGVGQDAYAWNEWTVYPEYEVDGDRRYVRAPRTRERRHYYPLSRRGAAVFLEFARWPEERGMDRKPLDTESNEKAAVEWAHSFGVLGVDPPELDLMGNSVEAVAFFLDGPGADGSRNRGGRNEGLGGPLETVERFAGEAWEANMALRLYEAAADPEEPDMETLVSFMSDRSRGFGDGPSTRQLHGSKPKYARNWALTVVEEIVERKVRGRCWPIPVPFDGSHEQGWAFDSLLGAMWLQMLWLMLGARRCLWCGKLLDTGGGRQEIGELSGIGGRRKPGRKRDFCPVTNGVENKCKADYNYHMGNGTSNKHKRREERDKRERERRREGS